MRSSAPPKSLNIPGFEVPAMSPMPSRVKSYDEFSPHLPYVGQTMTQRTKPLQSPPFETCLAMVGAH